MSSQRKISWPGDPPKPEAPAKPRPPFGRKNKYRAKPTTYCGVRYDSKAEAARAAELDRMKEVGGILWWHPKPGTFRLGCPENAYRPDFLVVGKHGVWVEDVKGMRTAKFKRDLKLWRAYGPCPLHVVNGKKVEVIEPAHEPIVGDGQREASR